jgi:long-chain acyl-CoA synthetase
MLYDRWREIAREFAGETALRDLPSGRAWTFAQLGAEAERSAAKPPIVFPRGNTPEFVIAVLQAWQSGSVVCPIEPEQSPPQFRPPPAPIAHVKITSATSGAPKLVAFTAEQLAADAENIVATMGLRRDWPNLAFISLAHSYGFSNLITPLLLHGIPLVLGGPPLPEIVRRALSDSPITLAAVPALWRVWHEADALTPNVRLAISAGAPLPLAIERDVFAQRGLKIHNFYGASECGGIAYDASDAPRADAACAGAPMRNVSLNVNSSGCLEVRGANVAETYWPQPTEALGGGVYRTSDLVELKDGSVFLRGRAADVINVAARKVAPETIERALETHSAVRGCLVFGVPVDEERGETIIAVIESAAEANAQALRQFLLERLESWQVPREFWFVESLGANARGKISRADWRQRFLERAGRA